jgi:hypothetical protein
VIISNPKRCRRPTSCSIQALGPGPPGPGPSEGGSRHSHESPSTGVLVSTDDLYVELGEQVAFIIVLEGVCFYPVSRGLQHRLYCFNRVLQLLAILRLFLCLGFPRATCWRGALPHSCASPAPVQPRRASCLSVTACGLPIAALVPSRGLRIFGRRDSHEN